MTFDFAGGTKVGDQEHVEDDDEESKDDEGGYDNWHSEESIVNSYWSGGFSAADCLAFASRASSGSSPGDPRTRRFVAAFSTMRTSKYRISDIWHREVL